MPQRNSITLINVLKNLQNRHKKTLILKVKLKKALLRSRVKSEYNYNSNELSLIVMFLPIFKEKC